MNIKFLSSGASGLKTKSHSLAQNVATTEKSPMQFINFSQYQADRRGALTFIIQATTGCADLYHDGSLRREERASMSKCDAICFSYFYPKQTRSVDWPELSMKKNSMQKATNVSHGFYRVAADEHANGFGHLMHCHGLLRILSAKWINNSSRQFLEQASILSRGLFGIFSVG